MPRTDRAPLLVSGLPRSGTTWLARLLAEAPGTSMLGREPMNPRDGQWRLGGEASAWTRWGETAPPRARRLLGRTYRGHAPQAYGRLGVRQWRAPLPGTRVVVKDPFALLSLPAVVSATGAVPVVVFRSAPAILSSYRRMGWRADVAEFRALGAPMPDTADHDDVAAMSGFWRWAHEVVLHDLDRVPSALLVSHAELTNGGEPARTRLLERLGLDPAGRSAAAYADSRSEQGRVREDRLHNFDRSPTEVMSGGDRRVSAAERERLEEATAEVGARLEERRLRLLG